MSTRIIARILLGVVITVMLGWTIYAYNTPVTDDTISEVMWGLNKYPLVPFLFGMVCGHWFWPKS